MAHVPAERCLSIIELLAGGADDRPLGDIAERLGLPKSGAHRLLATLVEHGWVEQDADTGFYRLTMRLAILGQQHYVATGIPDLCQPLLDRLGNETREFARLAVVDSESLVWVANAQGASGGLMYQPTLGTNTVPLYATASGKAWLATLPADRAVRIALKDGGFEHAGRYGPNVVRTVEALLGELEGTAKRGYGIAQSEAEPGVSAIAAAIRSGAGGAVVGTVSVAGPSVRMTEERLHAMAPQVLRTAAEISELWPLRQRPSHRPAGGIAAAA